MSELAFNTLGLEPNDVEDFVTNRVHLGLQGEPEFMRVTTLGIDVWGRVMEDKYAYFSGVPQTFQPVGEVPELVESHMQLWQASGVMIPNYQVVNAGGEVAVFTDAINGSSLDTATPEAIGDLGASLGRVILGNEDIRPAVQSIMPNNFINGVDSMGRVGIFMIDPDPYTFDGELDLTDEAIAGFVDKVTKLLCDAVGGDWDNIDERRVAMYRFITEFFPEIESMPRADLNALRAQSEALLYRDGVNIYA